MAKQSIFAYLGINTDDFQKGMGKAKKQMTGFEKAGQGFAKTLRNTMLTAFSISAITSFGQSVIKVTGEFQRFSAVLTNTLGSSSAAQQSIKMIQEFAAKTPFSVSQLTESFVKLANQGFKPTADEMTKLGDLASSTGKGFDQLTEAIIDAQTGEFERLKDFGIRAEKQGDKVTFAFKGVKTQTDFTADSIRQYILSLGDLEGVSGATAAISETLEGKISNLGDSWDSLLNTIGSGNSGVLNDTIEVLKSIVDEIAETEIATNRAAKLGFGRKLFSEVDGLGAKMLEFDKQFQTAMSGIYNGSTNVDELKAKVRALKTQFDSLNKGTDEGRAKSIIYADGIKLMTDKIKELTASELKATSTTNQLTKDQLKALEELNKKRTDLYKRWKSENLNEALFGVEETEISWDDFKITGDKPKGLLEGIGDDIEIPPVEEVLGDELDKVNEKAEALRKGAKDAGEAINTMFKTIATDGLATFGMALGAAFAGGDVMAIGMQFAQAVADSIGMLGKQLIQIGFEMMAIQEALKTVGWTNPALVIGGGIALVALASGMKGMMGNSVGFADGGLVTGSVFANIGEGIGTNSANPEVIAPLDKLKNFINPSGGGMGGGNVSFRIEGNTLVGILDRQQKTSKYSR